MWFGERLFGFQPNPFGTEDQYILNCSKRTQEGAINPAESQGDQNNKDQSGDKQDFRLDDGPQNCLYQLESRKDFGQGDGQFFHARKQKDKQNEDDTGYDDARFDQVQR